MKSELGCYSYGHGPGYDVHQPYYKTYHGYSGYSHPHHGHYGYHHHGYHGYHPGENETLIKVIRNSNTIVSERGFKSQSYGSFSVRYFVTPDIMTPGGCHYAKKKLP